jgi:hypothetical protein
MYREIDREKRRHDYSKAPVFLVTKELAWLLDISVMGIRNNAREVGIKKMFGEYRFNLEDIKRVLKNVKKNKD